MAGAMVPASNLSGRFRHIIRMQVCFFKPARLPRDFNFVLNNMLIVCSQKLLIIFCRLNSNSSGAMESSVATLLLT